MVDRHDGSLHIEGTGKGTYTSAKTYPSPSQSRDRSEEKCTDPFVGDSEGARPNSLYEESVIENGLGGRALSFKARPPSITDPPVPAGPSHYGTFAQKDETAKKEPRGRRKLRRRISLSDLLDSKTDDVPVRKAKSVDDLLNDDSDIPAERNKLQLTLQHNVSMASSSVFEHSKQIASQDSQAMLLQFIEHSNYNETGSPDIQPCLSLLKAEMAPVEATSSPQHPCLLVMSSFSDQSRVSAVSRDEFEGRLAQTEEQIKTLSRNQDLLLQLIKCTKHDITFPSIAQSMKEKRCPSINSAPFYTCTSEKGGGYKMCVRIYPNGDGKGKGSHLSTFLILMKGDFDNAKETIWPFNHKVTFRLINHSPGGKDIVTVISPGTKNKDPAYQKPSGKSGMNIPTGFPQFVSHKKLFGGGYVVNDCVTLRVIVDSEIDECLPQIPEHCSEK